MKTLDFRGFEPYIRGRGVIVDADEVIRQFDLLEERVEYLIEQCTTLEKDNSELRQQVVKLEVELEKKTEEETRHSTQRALIRSKIDNLLGRLSQGLEMK